MTCYKGDYFYMLEQLKDPLLVRKVFPPWVFDPPPKKRTAYKTQGKVSNMEVLEMRFAHWVGGWSLSDLAKQYDLASSTVGSLVKGYTRKDVEGPTSEEEAEPFKKGAQT